ncbi:SDR family NAD(P)-dependent oxidoreductase [Novosphingobium pentaromativorans]|nr:SDR family NAD(P)-dependent oxidoreductase [Novosphingobium pentaromativorans]AIT82129.1 oxidoreductase [Novosphingobium pentaromativorans US6-1]
MGSLSGKVAIVAGAGAKVGIGAAVARLLAQRGASVVVADLNFDGASAICSEIEAAGGRALALRLDIADEASVAAMVRDSVSAFGGIDFIHVNAADTSIRRQDTDAVSVPLEVFDQTIAVGLRGHLLCSRYAIPELLKRGGGGICYTSSDASMTSMPHYVSYVVSKAGLNGLMRHVATRWGKENIRANAVAPGLVLTDTVERDHTEKSKADLLAITRSPRLGMPEDIAAMVAYLASDDAQWVNGQVLSVNGGQYMH